MRRRIRISAIILASILGAAVLVAASVVLLLRSEWFSHQVRTRIIAAAEQATGARVEIGSFRFDWERMRATVDRFVLHGAEPDSSPPLFQAASVQVGLKIVSLMKRDVDILSLTLEKPDLRIQVAADGATNLPRPKVSRQTERSLSEQFLRLQADRFEVRDGFFQYANDRVPVDLKAENLRLQFAYEGAGPLYRGTLSARQFHYASGTRILPMAFDLDAGLTVEKDVLRFQRVALVADGMTFQLAGAMESSGALRTKLDVTGKVALPVLGRKLRADLGIGSVDLAGALQVARGEELRFSGTLAGTALRYTTRVMDFQDVSLRSQVELTGNRVVAEPLQASSPDGQFQGVFRLEKWSQFTVDGTISEVALSSLRRAEDRSSPWSGVAAGPVRARGEFTSTGVRNGKAEGEISITPVTAATPLEGFVNFRWDQQLKTLEFSNSNLETPSTQVSFSGVLGRRMQVSAKTSKLDEIRSAIDFAREGESDPLQVELDHGHAEFRGQVTGAMDDPVIEGHLSAANLRWGQHLVEKATAVCRATPASVVLEQMSLRQGQTLVEGSLSAGLNAWKPGGPLPLAAKLSVEGASIAKYSREWFKDEALDGTLSGRIDVAGSQTEPRVQARIRIVQPRWRKERFDNLTAELHFEPGRVEVRSARLEAGSAALSGTLLWAWKGEQWREGQAQFDFQGRGWRLGQLEMIRAARPDLDGKLTLDAAGSAKVESGLLSLTRLNGKAGLDDLAAGKGRIGSALATAETSGDILRLRLQADVGGTPVKGGGEWVLGSRQAGIARIDFAPLSFATLQEIWPAAGPAKRWPFAGVVAGNASVRATSLAPGKWEGLLNLTRVEISPNWDAGDSKKPSARFQLHNEGPVSMLVDSKNIRVQKARMVGTDTNIEAEGAFSFNAQSPWDLRLKGSVNLDLAGEFDPDIHAKGVARLDANIRGAMADPQLFGRLELADASLYFGDFPTGLEKARATLLFDRKRVSIDRGLTAQLGGGDLVLSGFLEFGGQEIRYRLQALAKQVRVRYPEGVSTLADADLNFSGSSNRSLLAGTVTVVRSGFNPRTDLGSLLAEAARPAPPAPPLQNELLRNMQLDVRILTAANAQFQSTLTRDIQGSADLRLRGSPPRPLLLGRIQVEQGEINFFGNKYTISRGEISFYNPVRIEPILDMDVETRVRGVVVTITFAGPVDKLNVSYRSDPPLRSNEIVALLTVGRSPESASSTLAGPSQRDASLGPSGNSLLGQALSAPISSRVQRFFGVSRVKIDPQLTGLEGTPQARLTIEQEVSRDITVTFVTNLNRSPLEQIVRVEWSINRTWSAFAVRDENGLFSVEFQYKKAFR